MIIKILSKKVLRMEFSKTKYEPILNCPILLCISWEFSKWPPLYLLFVQLVANLNCGDPGCPKKYVFICDDNFTVSVIHAPFFSNKLC